MKVKIKGNDIYRGTSTEAVGSIRANMVFFKGQPLKKFTNRSSAQAWAEENFKYMLRIERHING